MPYLTNHFPKLHPWWTVFLFEQIDDPAHRRPLLGVRLQDCPDEVSDVIWQVRVFLDVFFVKTPTNQGSADVFGGAAKRQTASEKFIHNSSKTPDILRFWL